MKHFAMGLVLACVCTVHGQLQIPALPAISRNSYSCKQEPDQAFSLNSDWNDADGRFSQYTRYPSQEKLPYDSKPDSQIVPSQFFNHLCPLCPWGGHDDQNSNHFGPETQQVYNQSPLQNLPKAWVAPPYHKWLKDFDDHVVDIKRHFTLDSFKDKYSKNFRYIVILHTVNSLSKEVAQHGWKSYENNYTNLVQSSMEEAITDPREVIARLGCVVYYKANRKIEKLRNLLTNQVTKFVCKAQPAACDTFIYGLVRMSNDEDLMLAEALLLLLGQASSTFQTSYARAFDAISTQNAFLYLLNAKDILRNLVFRISEVHIMLYPNGKEYPCFLVDATSPYYFQKGYYDN